MPKKVTIKTIASDLGLSFSTVAKALNHDPKLKKETIELVNQRATELGYQPNLMAKGLRGSSTKSIGFILNDIENPALTYILKRISVKMGALGYTTLICDSQYDEEIERRNILSVMKRAADAIIIFPVSDHNTNLELLHGIKDKVIILGNAMNFPDFHCVEINYALGGYLSAKEMLSHGHDKLLVITEPEEFPASKRYLHGIKQAFLESHKAFHEKNILYTPATIDNGYRLFIDFINKGGVDSSCSGVLCFCDSLAHGVYKACMERGISIPEEISVIGFDDNPLSAFSNPPLSSVYLPKEEIYEACSKILDHLLEENKENADSPIRLSVDPHLNLRQSVSYKQ